MRCSLVSNKIIQARERLGLTQQQLAEKLCVTNKAVSKWECGVTLPDISLLVPLCRVLGLTVQELLDEYDGKFGNTPGCQTTEDPAQDTLFAAQQHSHYLYIDLKTTSTVSPHLFGHNLEHTRASIMDGLSAQMIRNRKFAGAAARNGVALDWEGIGECVYFANEHRLPGSNANEAYVCHYAHNGMWRRNECQSQMIQNPIPNQVAVSVKRSSSFKRTGAIRLPSLSKYSSRWMCASRSPTPMVRRFMRKPFFLFSPF